MLRMSMSIPIGPSVYWGTPALLITPPSPTAPNAVCRTSMVPTQSSTVPVPIPPVNSRTRSAAPPTPPPHTTRPDPGRQALHGPNPTQPRAGPNPAGQLPHPLGRSGAALGHDLGGTELPAEVGTDLVAAHQHDLLGAQAPGGQHRRQPYRAVADHRHRDTRPDPGLDRAVVAGREHVGHRSEERRVGKECRSRWSPYH